MKRTNSRVVGAVLLLGAGIGIVISLVGLVGVWTAAPKVETAVVKTFERVSESLTTTQEGLDVIAESMQQASDTLLIMETVASEMALSVDQTIPMVDRAGTLVGEHMTEIVQETQTSLDAAQSSAKLVDDTLGLITSLPIIGRRYAPANSLSSSISGVSQSLDELPSSFLELQANLKIASSNLKTMQVQVQALGVSLKNISGSMEKAQGVVEDYQVQVTGLEADLKTFQEQVPSWLTGLKWGLTLFFLWMGIAQLGLFLQGAALLGSQQPAAATEVREEGYRG
jgi:hypothetical protein